MHIPLFLPFLAVFLFQGTTQYENLRQTPFDLHHWYVTLFYRFDEPQIRELMSPSVSITFCNGTLDIEGFIKYVKDAVAMMNLRYGFWMPSEDQFQPDNNTWIYKVSVDAPADKELRFHAQPLRFYNVTATRKSDGKFSIDTMKDLNCTWSK